MKRLLLSLLTLASLGAFAQTTMHVYSNGQRHSFEVTKVDSIVFIKQPTQGKGTLDAPFSCKEALEYVRQLPADTESDEQFYIKGKVVSINNQFSTQWGNATFYISDDGSATNQFYVYRALHLGNQKYAEGDALLNVGDEVIIHGKVVNYRGTTPETAQNKAYIYSLNGSTTQPPVPNTNANDISQNAALGRLEFPKVKGGNSIVLVHSTTDDYGINYAVEWDIGKKSSRWTCYQMNKGFQGSAGYYGNFEEDPDLPAAYRLSNTYDYYRGSGFSRGHICPSADRQYSTEANHQTFYYTNMQPQYYNFNAGENYGSPWVRLEGLVRTWTKQSSTETLYVVKGGTIEDDQLLTKVKNQLRVPKYFFVALLMKSSAGYKAVGFWMEHTDDTYTGSEPLANYACSIRELEQKTGIDFFCNLPDEVEERVETVTLETIVNNWGL